MNPNAIGFQVRHKDIFADKVIQVNDPQTNEIISYEIYGHQHDGTKVWTIIYVSPETETKKVTTEDED